MLALKFDAESFYKGLCDDLCLAADEIMQNFLDDVSTLKQKDYEFNGTEFKAAENYIVSTCTFYAHSILESYGTGTKMDKDNEYLQDYIGNTLASWNPLRKSYPIVGRAAGEYENIFGDTKTSTGRFAGKEMHRFGIKPTYAIQNAEKKLMQENGYATRIIESHLNEYIKTAGNYFYNVEV
jgi:hypothetical protein